MHLPHSYCSNLASLLKGICHVPAVLDTSITGLKVDSRLVQKGDLFLALSGSRSTSTDHILEAIQRGANAVVVEGTLFDGKVFEDGSAVELFVNNLKQQAGQIADRFFNSPSKSLSVIGVTGTNGKTSVASYIANYLSLGGVKSGLIGTLGYGIVSSEGTFYKETDHTTPNVVEVHRYLAFLRDAGTECVVMEVSSHGLTQGRVDGVSFEGVVFTNLSRDHLDYHGTMAAYGQSKRMLFEDKSLKFAVINNDDAYAFELKKVLSEHVELITYGIDSNADISVEEYQLNTRTEPFIQAQVNAPMGALDIHSKLMGRFNLSNLLAVIAVATAKKQCDQCVESIALLNPVEGRMEVIHAEGRPTVVVDYAHTPDALKNVLEALKGHCGGKVHLVFGCGGDRDKGKRPEMASIAEQLADDILVTDDNPRDESPDEIVKGILKGFVSQDKVTVLHDRKKAIKKVLENSDKNDLVLIAGKGHETWQEKKGVRIFFSDIDEVKRNLGLLSSNTSKAEVVND